MLLKKLSSSIIQPTGIFGLIILLIVYGLSPAASIWADGDKHDYNNNSDNSKKNTADKEDIIYGSGLIFGTNKDDFIIGSILDDIIYAKHGNDEVQSNIGNDQVYGDGGADTIQGGLNNDVLFGEGGNDNLIGGDGDDYLLGGSGDDHLWGGFGDDQLRGGSGADFFDCGEGTDEIKDFNVAQGDVMLPNCEIVNRV